MSRAITTDIVQEGRQLSWGDKRVRLAKVEDVERLARPVPAE